MRTSLYSSQKGEHMDFPKRKPNRLPSFDYSSNGAYFVTLCTEHRKNTLSSIVGDGSPVPKPLGRMAAAFAEEIPHKFPCARVDKYVIMPNHIHLLIFLEQDTGTGNPSPTGLGNIIGWFKYMVTKTANQTNGTPGTRIFQRSFHDHVIRGDQDYLKIWNYIDGNPSKWKEDCFYTP